MKVNTLNLVFVDETGEIRVEAWRDNLAKWVDKLKVTKHILRIKLKKKLTFFFLKSGQHLQINGVSCETK
jgi:DNA/RNA endonuclease YhcR with UshA esterase domain